MLVITENQTPLVRFAWLFFNQTIFQKFERTFLDQVAIDGKCVSTFEKCHLMAELKLKMSKKNRQISTFSISALPPEGAFQMLLHF